MQNKIEAEWKKIAAKHGFDADFERGYSNSGILTFRQGLDSVANINFDFQDRYASIYGQAGTRPANLIDGNVNSPTQYGNSYMEYDKPGLKDNLVWLDKVLGAARKKMGANPDGPVRQKAATDSSVKKLIALLQPIKDPEEILQVLNAVLRVATDSWMPIDQARYGRVADFLQKARLAAKK